MDPDALLRPVKALKPQMYTSHSRESGGNQNEMEHLTGGCFKLL